MFGKRAYLLAPLAVLFCPAALFGPALGSGASPVPETDLRKSLESFARVYAMVEENFADPVSPDQSI